ncbi:CDP-diacylglycerol--inositol 3-phosphatidyltransferase isoform X1 [Octopus sinensis]|uniref:CDP-diacylglycerol--inositol 3-phosphatidyltransferase isoform X1 n=1 Tax=Octopus sinensis TaxID=2607531 RepID=A0A6P7TLK1_9MOLL|nr:CDP-diacylglycerol--inositol 3-phosphatidyltransferase isoform X1 [Octopus sinensis]
MAAVIFYVPNIIGYVRLLLLFVAFLWYQNPFWFLLVYSFSAILDGIDGYMARKLNQVSEFGSLLDVVVDNIGRGMLWCHLHKYLYLISVVEWLTLVCTHCRGPNWKALKKKHPWIIERVMDKGFKTPAGVFTIAGLHVFPILLYAQKQKLLRTILGMSLSQEMVLIMFFMSGRLLCLIVEFYFIYQHVEQLCRGKPYTGSKQTH